MLYIYNPVKFRLFFFTGLNFLSNGEPSCLPANFPAMFLQEAHKDSEIRSGVRTQPGHFDSETCMKFLTGWLFAAQIFFGCANQAPPGGGPEDKTPPKILWTVPASDSVRVARKTQIQIAFSEAMNQSGTEKAVYISPYSPSKFSWEKNVLTVVPGDSLEEDRTCVVTIGTDAKDIHNNPLAQSYSFAFSTGSKIDRGTIAGRVISEKIKRISIWSYRLGPQGKTAIDSLVYLKRADYITQVGDGGKYQLSYLAGGSYRVFAVADQDENFSYTPSIDFIGIASKDMELSSQNVSVTNIDFMMFQEEASRFTLQFITSVGEQTLSLRLTRPLHSRLYFENHAVRESLKDRLKISDSASGAAVALRDVYANTNDLSEIRILADGIIAYRTYVLEAFGLVDHTGDTLRSEKLSFNFTPGDVLPTHGKLVVPQAISDPVLPDEFFAFYFDNGIQRALFEKSFSMTDSSSKRVNGKFTWRNSGYVEFHPAGLLANVMSYRISLNTDSILDWSGRAVSDTVTGWNFKSFKIDSLGTVSGQITDEDSARSGAFILTCLHSARTSRDYSAEIPKAGNFRISHLIPGKYNLIAFRDEDGNGIFSYGRVSPITFSERFTGYADTVIVRPNWETSGVTLRFRK